MCLIGMHSLYSMYAYWSTWAWALGLSAVIFVVWPLLMLPAGVFPRLLPLLRRPRNHLGLCSRWACTSPPHASLLQGFALHAVSLQ